MAEFEIKFLIPAVPGTYMLERISGERGEVTNDVAKTNVIAWAMGAQGEMYPVSAGEGPETRLLPILFPDGSIEGCGRFADSIEQMMEDPRGFFPA